MGRIIEAGRNIYQKTPEPLRNRIDHYKDLVNRKSDELTMRHQENVLLGNHIDEPPLFDQYTSELLGDPETVAIVASQHASHSIGPAVGEIGNRIMEIANARRLEGQKITGSNMYYARSIDSTQPKAVKKGFKRVLPVMEGLNVGGIYVLRDTDIPEDTPPEKKREMQKAAFRQQEEAEIQTVKEGKMFLLLVEGRVESGRRKHKGLRGLMWWDINGMIQLPDNSISHVAKVIKRQGKKPVIFFVGADGENRVYDPSAKRVTVRAKTTALARSTRVGKHLFPRIMRTRLDYPVEYDTITAGLEENGKVPHGQVERYVGQRLARLSFSKRRMGHYLHDETILHRVNASMRNDVNTIAEA